MADISRMPIVLKNMSDNIDRGIESSFREAVRRTTPKYRQQAKRAAGPDRILSGLGRGQLDVQFEFVGGRKRTILRVKPKGPWGIRDSTDGSSRTAAHRIVPKKRTRLKFQIDGDTVYARSVNHPGSRRRPYWAIARKHSLQVLQKRIPEETSRALLAAFNDRPYYTRGPKI